MHTPIQFSDDFSRRHIGPDAQETQEMLATLGVASLDELIDQTVPAKIRSAPMVLPPAVSEYRLMQELQAMANKNKVFKSHIGLGYYGTITPPVIQRNILENPGWYTQYTPYQAEIAQGRLEALINYQTMVADMTGLPIANASLLDEATAAAEAMGMFYALKGAKQGDKFFVDAGVFPQTLDVVRTRAMPLGIEVEVGNYKKIDVDSSYFGVLVQYPNAVGCVNDHQDFVDAAHAAGAKVAFATDLLALALLKTPGETGADVAIGTAQRFGVPMGFGGPHAAFFATKDEFKRNIPGRIIGVSVDADGNPAYRMALQTREQHIRREKATSNICTSQVLLAIMASMYAVYHGPKGITRIATAVNAMAHTLRVGLKEMGYDMAAEPMFDTVCFNSLHGLRDQIRELALAASINLNYSDNCTTIAIDETTTPEDVQALLGLFAKVAGKQAPMANFHNSDLGKFARQSEFLTHPVFNTHHSEHEMLRYIKHLEAKDLSLAFSMIPLGSCTMKLNATTEMLPVTWPQWGGLHPFAPANQTEGYQQLFSELTMQLKQVTGFAGISLQPNAGAQGEYTGLMVIREYFRQTGQAHRNVALIPQSAHGTNPASAVMAGMKVVVTKTDANGNIDIDDLRLHAEKHRDDLAVLMVTYPSTHGVFEEQIMDICALIHTCGGQVYMDGANMNAQVGLTSPAAIGADVCHLNLHKTFCIPHGGGGPGMGPIGVAAHLVPYLPSHVMLHESNASQAMGAVSAAPYGSASILLISYSYIRLMGAEGLTDATRYAILNANYLKARLEKEFDVLYTGPNGRAAHEMILDTRPFKNSAGIEVEDIAKRLMDYGFHAPTVSFPVAGTLMIEPTESETKAELDRFADAMLAIKKEIEDVLTCDAHKLDNPLKNAPHTAHAVMADNWNHPYSRSTAAFPLPYVRANKFWPSVARINNTAGDRNLVCTCPPLSVYEEA